MKAVVVTGVSSGIGRGAAQALAGAGFHVFGSVRRAADAQPLQDELGAQFTALQFDVTDAAAIAAAAGLVGDALAGAPLAGLVNNAGIAVAGPLLHLPLDELRQQLEVNVVGWLAVTQAFAPLLTAGARSAAAATPGRVVNISSVSGVQPFPMLGPYAASKAALEALSRVLRSELLPRGVAVVVIEPGNVETPIWDKMPDTARYRDTDYGPVLDKGIAAIGAAPALPVAAVAAVIVSALTAARPRRRYIVHRSPLARRLLGWLPAAWLDNAIAAKFGLKT